MERSSKSLLINANHHQKSSKYRESLSHLCTASLPRHLPMVRPCHNPLLKCAIDQQEEDDAQLGIHGVK